MAASVAGKVHADFDIAKKAIGGGFEKEYQPDENKAKKYDLIYKNYLKLGNFIENELTK
jgi:L-ribulokinase